MKWHAHVGHMGKHMNMVGDPGPGPLVLRKSGAALNAFYRKTILSCAPMQWRHVVVQKRFSRSAYYFSDDLFLLCKL